MMRSFLTLVATALLLVAAAHASSGKYFDSSLAELEMSHWNANQASLAKGGSETESPSGQENDSDDCT